MIKEQKSTRQRQVTRQLIGTREVMDYCLETYRNDRLVYFMIKPTNISVLSEESISARIYALMTVLKGLAELEFLCLNSRESYEDNKRFLRSRMEQEDKPAVRKLLELDLLHLDRIQVQMATAREFLVIIRLCNEKESEVFPYLNRIEKFCGSRDSLHNELARKILSDYWQSILNRMLQPKNLRIMMVSVG